MILTTVVVDDEARALSLMVDYVSKLPQLTLAASFQNAFEALEYLNNHPVDLLLLDIQMPDITGLDLLNSLQHKPMVIFTTAYSEYAVEGFELNAIDYLVKPIMFPRFIKAINKGLNQAKLMRQNGSPSETNSPSETTLPPATESGFIFVKVDARWERIQLSDITFIESCGDYVAIHLSNNKKLLSLQTMTQILNRLDDSNFVRVHRSYIVNLTRVDTIEKDHLLIEKQDISIGKSYRQEFLQRIGNKG